MKKSDFASMLFKNARRLTASQRVPHIAFLVLLELARHPAGSWHRGDDLARTIGDLTSNNILCSTRTAVAEGLLDCRRSGDSRIAVMEWRATAAGLRLVRDLLTDPATTPAVAGSTAH